MTNFIEPYNAHWKVEFEELKRGFLKTLDGLKLDIQHVGSTAIPGVFAKPILDIDIIIDNKMLLDKISARLEEIGYINKGEQGVSGRFAFRQSSEWTPRTDSYQKWQKHHLYVCFSDSLALKNHLLFRDALLNNKRLAKEYSQLKINLTNEKGMTKENYARQKTDFVISVLITLGLDEQDIEEIRKVNV
jgi:GrpB-like predicted nucleotidyltransferase (UPF0157 family)